MTPASTRCLCTSLWSQLMEGRVVLGERWHHPALWEWNLWLWLFRMPSQKSISGFCQIPVLNMSVPCSWHAKCHSSRVFYLWPTAGIQNSNPKRARHNIDLHNIDPSSRGEACIMSITICPKKAVAQGTHSGWSLLCCRVKSWDQVICHQSAPLFPLLNGCSWFPVGFLSLEKQKKPLPDVHQEAGWGGPLPVQPRGSPHHRVLYKSYRFLTPHHSLPVILTTLKNVLFPLWHHGFPLQFMGSNLNSAMCFHPPIVQIIFLILRLIS